MREILLSESGIAVPLIRSDAIPAGFRHGFTTRRGGVSAAPFDSLNLGGKWGDAPAAVLENQRRLTIAAGGRPIFFATQVHGAASVRADRGQTVQTVAATHADAVLTAIRDQAVGVYVADCVPVLIADAQSGACAAVHAGWRGTVAGVLSAALRCIGPEFGARMDDVRVAIGPSIGPCCFEVGPEVVSAVEAAFPGARAAGAIDDRRARPHVDLWILNRLAAESMGVAPDAIDVAEMCTSCDSTRFFSYRRDRGRTGQLAAFIVRGA
ncbi:MAG: peptidoglycan editing factor PgeF [Deltaproteobacteria bacterium]|nr:peptidoglycan editing factor PgeF [Deltaproteobacteria bacterium]